ncbi:FtsK/SpoIIIE domain-containing protein [Fundicoccus sp. Sow4_H7]|uniref:FtsK/SpoIIIE domain-containing protein n=1 Tax=Fundicoccus sp. Sow4_H7 TaxID=3438784 RepID=UPI003F8F8D15
MDIFSQLQREQLKKTKERRQYAYELYIDELINLINERPDLFVNEVFEEDPESIGLALRINDEIIKPVEYDNSTITISPEPLEYIKLFTNISNNQEASRKLFKQLMMSDSFKQLSLNHTPKANIWFNETSSHINLRPGLAEEEEFKLQAIKLGNINVHGLIAGRTGSGKSVFLNNIIQNLLTEYSPWELDIYLADFKKVELSRYVTKYQTPHINAVAATSEIRYIISLFEYLVHCMKARESLFTYLGVQNIKEFRSKFQVVLPRVMLIVDEFQQMFQESTYRQSEQIKMLLTSIAKLGRATGFHLLFASQDMSGSLSSRVMANFKLRFSLPADASVSSEILGNSAASTLQVGYVLANDKSGAIEDNIKYRVPYINDDEKINEDGSIDDSFFYERLKLFCDENQKFDFNKKQKFYQEDYQEDIDDLTTILDKIKSRRFNIISKHPNKFLDVFTLGYGVVYSNKEYDLETVFIEKGMNKNILIASPNIDDIGYVQDILAMNFKSSPFQTLNHFHFNFNPLVDAYNNLSSLITLRYDTDNIDQLEILKNRYHMRKSIYAAYNSQTLEEFLTIFINNMINFNSSLQKRFLSYKDYIFSQFKHIDPENLASNLQIIEKENPAVDYGPIKHFIQSYIDNFSEMPRFEQDIYWISTLDHIERMPRWFNEMMRNGSDLNMLFINAIASEEIPSDIVNKSEYIFVSGNIEKIYTRTGVEFTHKGLNSIVIDFKIRSLNTQRSFKKYRINHKEVTAPSLDFDAIMEEVE